MHLQGAPSSCKSPCMHVCVCTSNSLYTFINWPYFTYNTHRGPSPVYTPSFHHVHCQVMEWLWCTVRMYYCTRLNHSITCCHCPTPCPCMAIPPPVRAWWPHPLPVHGDPTAIHFLLVPATTQVPPLVQKGHRQAGTRVHSLLVCGPPVGGTLLHPPPPWYTLSIKNIGRDLGEQALGRRYRLSAVYEGSPFGSVLHNLLPVG